LPVQRNNLSQRLLFGRWHHVDPSAGSPRRSRNILVHLPSCCAGSTALRPSILPTRYLENCMESVHSSLSCETGQDWSGTMRGAQISDPGRIWTPGHEQTLGLHDPGDSSITQRTLRASRRRTGPRVGRIAEIDVDVLAETAVRYERRSSRIRVRQLLAAHVHIVYISGVGYRW
jgi:hypothetical protein